MDKIAVIEAHDKYGVDIIRAEDGTVESAALILLKNRVDDMYWYDEDDYIKISYILEDNDGTRAWDFLRSRRDYEYEWVEAKII